MKTLILFIIGLLFYWTPGNLKAATLETAIKDPTLVQAWAFLKAGQPSKTLQMISGFRPNAETRLSYHFIYGRALEGMNKPLEAIEHYRFAFLYAPSVESKELALLERAEAYYRIGNFYEAKLTYSLFFSTFSKPIHFEKASLGMARCLVSIKSYAQALSYYEKAGDGVETIFGKANLLHQLGRIKEAHECFQKGISRDKEYFLNSEELIFAYGENLQQMGKNQEALQYLSIELKNPILKKKAELALGIILGKSGNSTEAKKYFDSALTSTDRQTKQEALFQLAELKLSEGRKNEARQGFLEYVKRYPTGKAAENVMMRLAKMEMDDGHLEEAGKWMKKVVLGFPPNKATLNELEGLFLKLKEKDPLQMLSLWKALGSKLLESSREPFLLIMSESLKGTGRPFFELLHWLALNGSERVRIRSLIALAKYQVDTGNLDSAQADLKFLKKSKGKVSSDEILRLEAMILHAQGAEEAAFERLFSIKKITLQDLPLLESTITSAKDINKAIPFFEKNLQQLGGNSNSYIRLGDLLYEKGKKKEALQYYQKALEKDPLNEWGLFRVGSLTSGEASQNMLKKIKNGNSLLGKLAGISLKEKEVERKIGETF